MIQAYTRKTRRVSIASGRCRGFMVTSLGRGYWIHIPEVVCRRSLSQGRKAQFGPIGRQMRFRADDTEFALVSGLQTEAA